MDTSKEYIQQCEKAEEIQDLWHEGNCYNELRARIGDCVWLKSKSELRYFTLKDTWVDSRWECDSHIREESLGAFVTNLNGRDYGGSKGGYEDYKAVEIYIPVVQYWTAVENVIWLPHQDQLQEMLDRKEPVDLVPMLMAYIYTLASGDIVESFHQTQRFKSMEQLWLAFVMKEKFNKVWSTEKGEEWITTGKSSTKS